MGKQQEGVEKPTATTKPKPPANAAKRTVGTKEDVYIQWSCNENAGRLNQEGLDGE